MRLSRPLIALSVAGALVLGDAALAGAAPGPQGVAAAFGNTVKARYSDGKFQRIWFQADGGWEAVGRKGKASSGKWSVKDDKVCLKQSKPFPAPFRYCTVFPPGGGIGTVWSGRDWEGEPIQLTLVKGIERP